MNLLLLSNESQNLISDFDIEYKQQMQIVMDELLLKNKERMENNYCYNCGSNADPQYLKKIFWREYKFCSGWCQYDVEYDMRKSCRRMQR